MAAVEKAGCTSTLPCTDPADLQWWIRLARMESPRRATALVKCFGGPRQLFKASEDELVEKAGLKPDAAGKIRQAAKIPVDGYLRTLEKLGADVVTFNDPRYPQSLRNIYDPPAVLFVRGEIREEDRFAVGIIGTRLASEYGKATCIKICRSLAEHHLTIVSGGARGIDTSAHRGALLAGGRTIAVLGTGIDVPYPRENEKLLNEIAESGAVVSEFLPGAPPEAWRFPVRNRLVSGLSIGVLVVESKCTGGAMITANIAAEQGRDVWAVPGSAGNSTSEGPHQLIRDGAKLVERAEDILEELGISTEKKSAPREEMPCNLTPDQAAIIHALSLEPKPVDAIITECKLSPAIATSQLTMLEMLGLIRRVPGKAYIRSV
jgi:DNA processing protein